MHLVGVNLGKARSLRLNGADQLTGIFKQPVACPVVVTRHGLEGDAICSTVHHGGPDQAVYIYGSTDYAWWTNELGRAIEPGTFGENLTISAFKSAPCRVGDRLHIGDVVLEITSPRIPCATFAARMEDPTFPERFRAAERPGVYCRVIHEGVVTAGDVVRLEPARTDTVTMLEIFRDFYQPELTTAAIQRFLAAPIAIRARLHKEKQLLVLQSTT